LSTIALFDIIVIGSGPAGCAAACTSVKAGLNVLIITDEAEHNTMSTSDPTPLESIHPGVSSLLNQIDALGIEKLATRSLYTGIYAGGTYTPLGEDENGIWQGMHINREIFNYQLLQRIQTSGGNGVSVKFNVKVENFIHDKNKVIGIKTGSDDLYAKYIIDASGKKGIGGKKLNFKRRFFSPPLACWTGVSEYNETFPFDPNAAHFIPGKNGWTWLAPQPPQYCTWTRLSVVKEKSLLPSDELKDYPIIGKIKFANMRWRLFRPVCSEGIILCGDAAGILDPAAGQGIFNALLSGIQAGNTVISCIHKPDLASFILAQYDDWFVQQFEGKVKRLNQYYKDHGITI
jgi:flavin-dependent dehydrogenase